MPRTADLEGPRAKAPNNERIYALRVKDVIEGAPCSLDLRREQRFLADIHGTVSINADKYGKGVLVKMTVADWLILDELIEQMAKL